MALGNPNGTPRSTLLLGKDHAELGAVAIAEAGPNVAAGISRGRFPKGYPHVDPNEDAVLAASIDATTILAVADGHRGIEAGHAAIEAVADSVRLSGDESLEDIVRRLTEDAIAAVAAVIPHLLSPRNESRTSLTVAAIRKDAVASTTVGDSICYVATRRRAARVGEATEFLSAETDPQSIQVHTVPFPTKGTVIVTSDGIPDFTGDTERLVQSVSALSSRAAIERLVDAAFAGGAGDNLSVAIMTQGSSSSG